MSSEQSSEKDVEGHLRFSGGLTGPESTEDDVEGHAVRVSNPPSRPEDLVPGEGRMRVTDDGQSG